MPAEGTNPKNKPDIIIHDNKQGTCVLIDVAIPGDRNVIKKGTVKILKYKDLVTEIQRVWNGITKVIPVITGATGTISKHSKYLSNIRESTALMNCKNSRIGHCTQTAENANVKVQNIFHGRNNISCGTNCNYRTAATLYALKAWFVSGI